MCVYDKMARLQMLVSMTLALFAAAVGAADEYNSSMKRDVSTHRSTSATITRSQKTTPQSANKRRHFADGTVLSPGHRHNTARSTSLPNYNGINVTENPTNTFTVSNKYSPREPKQTQIKGVMSHSVNTIPVVNSNSAATWPQTSPIFPANGRKNETSTKDTFPTWTTRTYENARGVSKVITTAKSTHAGSPSASNVHPRSNKVLDLNDVSPPGDVSSPNKTTISLLNNIRREGQPKTHAIASSKLYPMTASQHLLMPDTLSEKRATLKHPQSSTETESGSRKLHIGGLFQLSGPEGGSELAAAQMAVRHVNQMHFIPGYELVLLHNDTKCDPGYAADAFYDFMYLKPQLMMLIGTKCTEVAKTLGEIVKHWNLLLVSYAAISPALSDREKYPTFYRLAPADSAYNEVRKTFIQHFGWDTVAALYEDDEIFTLAMNDMFQELEGSNISVKASLSFRSTGDDLNNKLKELKTADARIIIGSFREESAPHVFCQAYHLGLYGQRYVWLLRGFYSYQWWSHELVQQTNCTQDQLAQAVEGYFTVTSFNGIIGNEPSISGYAANTFLTEYNAFGVPYPSIKLVYDTVWTVALTLKEAMDTWNRRNQTQRLEDFNYYSENMATDFRHSIESLDFMGVSGPVSFMGPDRQGVTVLEQNQGGRLEKLGLFNPDNKTVDVHCLDCVPVYWPDGVVPADKYTRMTRLEFIRPEVFYTVCAVAWVGIYLAVVFLGFNLYHRKLRYIKLSSPKLNNVAVLGCILIYLAVIALGLDDALLPLGVLSYVCTIRALLLSIGFSLAFGAMFTKTYRVHQIFRGCHSGLVKSKMLKDKQLMFIIVTLLILDVAVVSLWAVIDPMYRTVTNFTVEHAIGNQDVLIIHQLSKCHSVHMPKWMGVFYAYKGLLLLFGVYMVWEIRHVKIPVLNDSKYIGMNIYNVVVSSVTVVALSNLMSDRPTLSFSLVSALILLSTTALLCLLFLPKMYAILKHNGAPVVNTSGLVIEANTRRFVVDEKRELQYRAEVQNRVYKRELNELHQESLRLQRDIDQSNDSYSDQMSYLMYETDTRTTTCSAVTTASASTDRREPFKSGQDNVSVTKPPKSPKPLDPKPHKPRFRSLKCNTSVPVHDRGARNTSRTKLIPKLKHSSRTQSLKPPQYSPKMLQWEDMASVQPEFFPLQEHLEQIPKIKIEEEEDATRMNSPDNPGYCQSHTSCSLLSLESATSDSSYSDHSALDIGDLSSIQLPCTRLKSAVEYHLIEEPHRYSPCSSSKHSSAISDRNKDSSFNRDTDVTRRTLGVKGSPLAKRPISLDVPRSNDKLPTKEADQRAITLKRELTRLQGELRTLGKVEMQVSYV